MKYIVRTSLVAGMLALALQGVAQNDDDHTITDGIGRTYLSPNSFAPVPPSTFAVGTAPTTGFALDVHGEQMNPPLGNVFKTNGPDDMDTYWRMFRDGKEYGNIFNLTAKFSTFPLLFSHSIKLINL